MDQQHHSKQLLDTIRERSDLLAIASEYLSLKKTGQNYTGLCPFHEEKTASFNINPAKQFFHCFGCGTGGDIFQFVSKIEGLSFPETLRRLAEKAGIPLPSYDSPKAMQARSEAEEIYHANAAAADYFHHNLITHPEGEAARNYLALRGLSSATIRDFSIGYALSGWDQLLKTLRKKFSPGILEKAGLISKRGDGAQSGAGHFDRFRNRVLFPIRNPQGKVVGFGGRVLGEGEPKYLNTAETPVFKKSDILYALDRQKIAGQPLVIVEGYLDVITAIQSGIPNVVATLGTALTPAHLRLARRFSEKIVLVFDGDAAGIRAALRTAPLLIDEEKPVEIVSLPSGKDPDTFIRNLGKPAFLAALTQASPVMDFCITQSIQATPAKTVADKMGIIRQIVPFIHRLRSQVEKSHYLKVLSDRLILREEDVRAEYARLTQKETTGVSKSKQSPAVQQNTRLPHDEESILMLLIQGLLAPDVLNEQLSLEDFTHPLIRTVMSAYWHPEEKIWRMPEPSPRMTDVPAQALVSRLAVAEVDTEQAKQIETDCLRMLRKKKIDRTRNEIEHQLKQVAGNLEAEHLLKKKIMDLYRASSSLTMSH